MGGVGGEGDGLLLHLLVVGLVVEVEGDLLGGGLLNNPQANVDIAVHDGQVAGLDELIAFRDGELAGVDMGGVGGKGDGLLLHLLVVGLIVEVEGDLLGGGLLNNPQANVDIAVHDGQVAGLDELIAFRDGELAGVDMGGVGGKGDGLLLHLLVVGLIIEVEGDLQDLSHIRAVELVLLQGLEAVQLLGQVADVGLLLVPAVEVIAVLLIGLPELIAVHIGLGEDVLMDAFTVDVVVHGILVPHHADDVGPAVDGDAVAQLMVGVAAFVLVPAAVVVPALKLVADGKLVGGVVLVQDLFQPGQVIGFALGRRLQGDRLIGLGGVAVAVDDQIDRLQLRLGLGLLGLLPELHIDPTAVDLHLAGGNYLIPLGDVRQVIGVDMGCVDGNRHGTLNITGWIISLFISENIVDTHGLDTVDSKRHIGALAVDGPVGAVPGQGNGSGLFRGGERVAVAVLGHIALGLYGNGIGASILCRIESIFFQRIAGGLVLGILFDTGNLHGLLTQQVDDLIVSEVAGLHRRLGLLVAQVDVDPAVVEDTHIQLISGHKDRVELCAIIRSINLDSLNIVGRYLVVPALVSCFRDFQIADRKPRAIIVPLVGIHAHHSTDGTVVTGISLSLTPNQGHAVNHDCRCLRLEHIRHGFIHIPVLIIDAGMGETFGSCLSGIDIDVPVHNGAGSKLRAAAVVAAQLPADKDIVSAERGGTGHLVAQRSIARYIDGVIERPGSRFRADFQIEVHLVADGPGLAVLSKRQLNMFCCCNAASAGYFKILTTKYSGYRFCQLSINGTGKAYNNCLDLIRSNIIGIRIKAVGSEKPRSCSGV